MSAAPLRLRPRAVMPGVAMALLLGAAEPFGASGQEPLAVVDLVPEAAAEVAQPRLRREGDFVVERAGRLLDLADGAVAVVFESPVAETDAGLVDRGGLAGDGDPRVGVDDTGMLAVPPPREPVPDLPPMVLQPGRLLEALLAVRDSGPADARFAFSGRVQRYRGRNHLLLTGFEGLLPADAPPATESAASSGSPSDPAEPDDPLVGPPGGTSTDAATDAVADLMASMDAEGRAAAAPPSPPVAVPPAPAASGRSGPGWKDAELVHRRLGRVVSTGPQGSHPAAAFVFDSGDPPLQLLASSATERAERLNEARDDSLVFELSGQVQVTGREAWVLPSSLRFRPSAGRVDEPAYP